MYTWTYVHTCIYNVSPHTPISTSIYIPPASTSTPYLHLHLHPHLYHLHPYLHLHLHRHLATIYTSPDSQSLVLFSPKMPRLK